MVNAALFFAEVYLIFSKNSMGVNWNFVSQMTIFIIICTILSALFCDFHFKKRMRKFRYENDDVAADEIVKRIKMKSMKYLKYSALLVFIIGGGGSLLAAPYLPFHTLLLALFALFCAPIYTVSRDALMLAEQYAPLKAERAKIPPKA